MKKLLLFGGLFILFLFMIKDNKKEIRVRVIPNDNSSDSIAIKKEVVGCLKEIISLLMNENMDYQEMDIIIENNLGNICKALEKFNCKVTYGNYTFPKKAYNGNILKSKRCKTLLVEIGNADGDNWWGLLYPDLLGIDSEEKIEYHSYIYDLFRGKSYGD